MASTCARSPDSAVHPGQREDEQEDEAEDDQADEDQDDQRADHRRRVTTRDNFQPMDANVQDIPIQYRYTASRVSTTVAISPPVHRPAVPWRSRRIP